MTKSLSKTTSLLLSLLALSGVLLLVALDRPWAYSLRVTPSPPNQPGVPGKYAFALGNPIQISPPGESFREPRWSPCDPTRLSLVSDNGTYVYSTLDNTLQKISEEPAAPFYAWLRDCSAIYYRDLASDGTLSIKVIDVRTGGISVLSKSTGNITIPGEADAGSVVYAEGGSIRSDRVTSSLVNGDKTLPYVYQWDDGHVYVMRGGQNVRVSGEDGFQHILPILSPDALKVLYITVGKGIEIVRLDSSDKHLLGRGVQASWSPDSRFVVFVKSTEDGYKVLSSDLYIADPSGTVARLTNTPLLLEQYPSWSADQKRLAFEADGAIYIANLSITEMEQR